MKLRVSAVRRRNPKLAVAIEPWVTGDVADIPVDVWRALEQGNPAGGVLPFDEWPRWARSIAWFRAPQDAGVGDTIHRMLGSAGVLFEATMEALGVPCRCPERKTEFNARFPYA